MEKKLFQLLSIWISEDQERHFKVKLSGNYCSTICFQSTLTASELWIKCKNYLLTSFVYSKLNVEVILHGWPKRFPLPALRELIRFPADVSITNYADFLQPFNYLHYLLCNLEFMSDRIIRKKNGYIYCSEYFAIVQNSIFMAKKF